MARTNRFPTEAIPQDFFSWDFEAIRNYLSEGRKCFNDQCAEKHQWSATQKVAYFREALIQARLTEIKSAGSLTAFLGLCNLEIERLKPDAEREAADRERQEQRWADRRKNRHMNDFPVNIGGYRPIGYGAEATPEPDEADVPNKFTRKQVMALLDALLPEFKDADNTRKAEFIAMLSPYNGTAKIAQEYSYLRHDEYSTLVDDWKLKFQKSGRGRKKKLPGYKFR